MRWPSALSVIVGIAACAAPTPPTPPTPPPPAPTRTLIEPRGHRPAPDRATLPRDLEDLGAMIPRWQVDSGPWAALSATRTFQVQPTKGTVRALDNRSGAAQWEVEVAGLAPPRLPPASAPQRVLVPTSNGLVALDSGTGRAAWTWPGAVRDLVVTGTSVHIVGAPAGGRGVMTALDALSGEPQWTLPCLVCAWVDQLGDRHLLRSLPGTYLVARDGRVEATYTDLASAEDALLTPDGLLVRTSTAVQRRVGGRTLFSVPVSPNAQLRRVQDHLLLASGEHLLGLDPATGATRWRIHLDPDLVDRLRLDQARHFPEGELMVPTEDLFGNAALLLLIRDDGTLRAVRYGFEHLERVLQHDDLALYATRDGLILSGTRRRGAPIRHYETLADDVAFQIDRLTRRAVTAQDEQDQRRARTWLQRLGREAWQQPVYAAIAGAEPDALAGLLRLLALDHPQDQAVLRQVLLRLAVTHDEARAVSPRRRALAQLAVPMSDDLYGALADQAPRWLEMMPAAGFSLRRRPFSQIFRRPEHPGAEARAWVSDGRVTLQDILLFALDRGDAERLYRRLEPIARAKREPLPCPWPDELRTAEAPTPPGCPMVEPPPGAARSPDGDAAIWRASGAGRRDDVWIMFRDGIRWSQPYLTGLQAPGRLRLVAVEGGGFEIRATTSPAQVVPGRGALAADRDRDGLTDLLEARIGTDPRRSDSDRDGQPDGEDPSPSCADVAPESEAEAARRTVAAVVASLAAGATSWRDTSERCLPVTVITGRLFRGPQANLPNASDVWVNLLEGEARAKAVQTAVASGQLRGPPSPEALIAVRHGIRHGPLSDSGATFILARVDGRWQLLAIVDRWVS